MIAEDKLAGMIEVLYKITDMHEDITWSQEKEISEALDRLRNAGYTIQNFAGAVNVSHPDYDGGKVLVRLSKRAWDFKAVAVRLWKKVPKIEQAILDHLYGKDVFTVKHLVPGPKGCIVLRFPYDTEYMWKVNA